MKVTVYYDYICPYCFLGSIRLEALAKEFPLEIEHKGIEIHPEIPPEGKKGRASLRFKQIADNIADIADEDDIRIKLPPLIANSRLSLEASEFAKTKGRFNEFHKAIYGAYFEHGENIGDKNVILRVGESVGIPIRELEDCLKGRTMLGKIEENKRDAQKNMVMGVPTFIFSKFPLHGVQSVETFRHVIARAIEKDV